MKALTSLLLATLAVSTFTFAANNNQANFTLPQTARVGSTDLPAGDYKAQWTAEAGGAVKIEIMRHGKTVVTAEGKLKDLQQPSHYTAVVTKPLNSGDNAVAIDEIDFNNRSQALVFGE
jgi:hypothetical protein